MEYMTKTKMRARDVSFFYGTHQVLKNVSAEIFEHAVTAITGPSGQGKSTLLTVFNRLWESIPRARIEGRVEIVFQGRSVDIYAPAVHLPDLRRKVGMVFQKPNPLPMSIFRNIAFPLKLEGIKDKEEVERRVEAALKRAFLWDEVKDRLAGDARSLSGGQQQRLCIARALIVEPDVLMMDEPTSSLDSRAVGIIEKLIEQLKEECTLLLVSHQGDQVSRIADVILELEDGNLTRIG